MPTRRMNYIAFENSDTGLSFLFPELLSTRAHSSEFLFFFRHHRLVRALSVTTAYYVFLHEAFLCKGTDCSFILREDFEKIGFARNGIAKKSNQFFAGKI